MLTRIQVVRVRFRMPYSTSTARPAQRIPVSVTAGTGTRAYWWSRVRTAATVRMRKAESRIIDFCITPVPSSY